MSGRVAGGAVALAPAIRRFVKDERGAHTIEFCIWLPLFVFFLAAAVDASLIYLTHTEMWNVARDTARRMTTRELDAAAAEQHAFNELLLGGRQYFVEARQDGVEAVVRIRTFITDASAFGIFGIFEGDDGWIAQTLDVEVQMSMEPALI